MSRTDAHNPCSIRVARREVSIVAVHRCAGRDCDLPDLVPGWTIGRVGRCHWDFVCRGVNVCSCWTCDWHRRPEVRRSAVRAELLAAVREWNAGYGEAGWGGVSVGTVYT